MWHIPILWEYVANRIMDISSISTPDFINISAHYWSWLNGIKRDEDALLARGYTPEQLKKAQRKVNITEIKDLLRFTTPITRFEYPLMGYALTLLENYEKGNLPFPGSVSEQPAQVIEIFNLLMTLKQKAQLEKHESQYGRYDQNKPGVSGRRSTKKP